MYKLYRSTAHPTDYLLCINSNCRYFGDLGDSNIFIAESMIKHGFYIPISTCSSFVGENLTLLAAEKTLKDLQNSYPEFFI